MITNSPRQRDLRGPRLPRAGKRAAVSDEQQALLAWRLTPRDRWLLRMVWEHRVLTSSQVISVAFPSARSGQIRLRELCAWGALSRFQPFVTVGSAPMHYVLAPAGAAVLAAEDGVDVKRLGYRHDRALAIAHSLRLAHTVGVGDWFTALAAGTRRSEECDLEAWWSETRCARHFGDLVKPDGYGRWRRGGRRVDWFLEYDTGTEPLTKVANKLHGYAALAKATGITTPLLVWLHSARRESAARQALSEVWSGLETPMAVPVATGAVDLLPPTASPADAFWLPLDAKVGAVGQRRELHDLLDAWPHVPPPVGSGADSGDELTTQAPNPMPPTGG